MKKTVCQLTLIGAFAVCALSSLPALSEEAAAPAAAPPAPPVAEAPELTNAPDPAATEALQTVAGDTPPAAPTASSHEEWLAEVRAQRKAQRDRVSQAREQYQAHYPDTPWNEDMEAYRENMRDRVTQYQEDMRARRRWMNPRGEYMRDMQEIRRNTIQAQAQARREQWEKMSQQAEQQVSTNPYGWNNPWYFQGY